MSWDHLRTDFKDVLRSLRKHPGVTAVAVFSLTAAFAINIFFVANISALWFGRLVYPESDRLTFVASYTEWRPQRRMSYDNFAAIQEHATVFESLGVAMWSWFRFSGEDELISGVAISTSAYTTLREWPRPLLGRMLDPTDDLAGAPPVLILSHGLWRRRFAEDSSIIGRQIVLDGPGQSVGVSYTVVGVAAPRSSFVITSMLWINLGSVDPTGNGGLCFSCYLAIGRLKPGVTLAAASSEMRAIARGLRELNPEWNRNLVMETRQLGQVTTFGNEDGARKRAIAGVSVRGAVLLLAAVNFAIVLLARGIGRRREYAVRAAMGASPARLARPLVLESLLLSFTGCGLGTLVAWRSLVMFDSFPEYFDSGHTYDINPTFLATAFGVALIVGIVFGVAPARVAAKTDLQDTLGRGGSGSGTSRHERGTRNVLVLLQVTTAVAFTVITSLVVDGYLKMRWQALGFEPTDVVRARMAPFPTANTEDEGQIEPFRRGIEERVSLIGWAPATAVTQFGYVRGEEIGIDANSEGGFAGGATLAYVTSDYFRTMGTTLLRGRSFARNEEATSAPIALVSATAARALSGGENILGRRLNFKNMTGGPVQVVGVIADVKDRYYGPYLLPAIYLLSGQLGPQPWPIEVYARTAGTAPTAQRELASLLRAAAPNQERPPSVTTLQYELQRLSRYAGRPVYTFVPLALFAVLLAAIAVHGMLAQAAAERMHEMGIRRALGARARDIVRTIGVDLGRLVLAGVVLGAVVAVLARDIVEATIATWIGEDWTMAAAGTVVFAIAALLGAAVPLRRAVAVDPMDVLREE